MNICILTGKVITIRKLFIYKNAEFYEVTLCIPNLKKQSSYFTVKSILTSRTAKNLFKILNERCLVTFEGFIYIKRNVKKIDHTSKSKIKRDICIKMSKIYGIF